MVYKQIDSEEEPSTYRDMQFRVESDKHPPIRAMVMQDEAAMREHLDIYRDPNTRFRVLL